MTGKGLWNTRRQHERFVGDDKMTSERRGGGRKLRSFAHCGFFPPLLLQAGLCGLVAPGPPPPLHISLQNPRLLLVSSFQTCLQTHFYATALMELYRPGVIFIILMQEKQRLSMLFCFVSTLRREVTYREQGWCTRVNQFTEDNGQWLL